MGGQRHAQKHDIMFSYLKFSDIGRSNQSTLFMERISVFHMLKIGVGPSSSHTLGPWRAAERWLAELSEAGQLDRVQYVKVHLYGSLAKTGHGHGTDIAVMMGLMGEDPETTDTSLINSKIAHIGTALTLPLGGKKLVVFSPDDVVFHTDIALPFHANGLRFVAYLDDNSTREDTYYSLGGGFIMKEGQHDTSAAKQVKLPYPTDTADEAMQHCATNNINLFEMIWANEQVWRPESEVRSGLLRIWNTMLECAYKGCHTDGTLPGGLNVTRRAPRIHRQLLGDKQPYRNAAEWLALIQDGTFRFKEVMNWVSCFALAVNEENAAFGRVVTAPTNGAAGVIPAVLLYYICLSDEEINDDDIIRFLCIAAEIGSYFKKGATISAAMGGCQAEIGVSAAMAAAALTACMGGTTPQTMMAAEIAMEHHLGMTCDPIGGLVQIPCIERNSMGAIKAINAANLALQGDPALSIVSLDSVVRTMWQTAQDMNHKYKETAEGGLAVNVSVGIAEC